MCGRDKCEACWFEKWSDKHPIWWAILMYAMYFLAFC